jgi:hypothetical protein
MVRTGVVEVASDVYTRTAQQPPVPSILSCTFSGAARDEKSPARGAHVPTPALVRTAVPMLVGSVLSFLATHGIDASAHTEALSVVFTTVLGGAYYFVASALESRWSVAGLLLGSTARPTYAAKHRKTSIDPASATPDSPEARP